MIDLRSLLAFACVALALPSHAQDDTEALCASMVEAIGMPEVSGGHDHVVICRVGHMLAHSHVLKTPIWVVERLEPSRFVGSANRDRLCKFVQDPDLERRLLHSRSRWRLQGEGEQRERLEFRLARGHMAPAADMKWDDDAMKESCFLSNIAPQHGINLNRHIWADLEALVRDWTCDRQELYVVTGPIYDQENPDTLGDGVGVPTAFYKVAYEPRQRRAIAFILPNEPVKKSGQQSVEVLKGFVVEPSEVEQRAGVRLSLSSSRVIAALAHTRQRCGESSMAVERPDAGASRRIIRVGMRALSRGQYG